VTANAVSAFGLVTGTLAGATFAATSFWPSIERPLLVLAAAFVQLRLLANLPGWNGGARGGISSPTGPLWNEMPDRAATCVHFVGVGLRVDGEPEPRWLAVLSVAPPRTSEPKARRAAPQRFCDAMAKPHPMALVNVAALALAAVASMCAPPWNSTAGRACSRSRVALVVGLGVVTIVRRVSRAARALATHPR